MALDASGERGFGAGRGDGRAGRWRGRGQQGGKAGALGSGTADRSGMTQSQSLPPGQAAQCQGSIWNVALGFWLLLTH